MSGSLDHEAPAPLRSIPDADGRDRWTVTRTVLAAWLGFSALFAVLEPAPTAGLPVFVGLLVWLVHIGLGLVLAIAAARVLVRFPPALRLPPAAFVAVSGLLGALLFAPVALGLEAWLPSSPAEASGEADGLLDKWESRGGALALAAEFLQMAPSYLLAWMLINAEPLLRRPLLAEPPRDPGDRVLGPIEAAPAPREALTEGSSAGATNGGTASSLFERLPPAIGTDLVAVSSDQHYLEVTTARGSATLLGTLDAVERELGDAGLRVHRSHWIALAHVRRVQRTQAGWTCVMSNGRKVPISRRRWSAVQERLGKDFSVDPAATENRG